MQARQLILLSLALAVTASPPTVVEGQQATTDTVVVSGERFPLVSGVLEFYLPTIGFAYGGDWKRGLIPNAFRVGSFIGLYLTFNLFDFDE